MSKEECLRKFRERLNNLRIYAKETNVSDAEVEEIFKNGIILLKETQITTTLPHNVSKKKTIISFVKYSLVVLSIVFLIYILLNVHQPTSSIVLRNVQGLIHPGFKFLRSISVPIIEMFPILTSK